MYVCVCVYILYIYTYIYGTGIKGKKKKKGIGNDEHYVFIKNTVWGKFQPETIILFQKQSPNPWKM